ncbi:MAG: hypothetical protein BWX50_00660 [Euryarchaeota archaeon ADurb.Bin009]|nr:MAG: hypothetical protein BWX50_00660 [Euryarchaeota archaeon ADurb.Bin009]
MTILSRYSNAGSVILQGGFAGIDGRYARSLIRPGTSPSARAWAGISPRNAKLQRRSTIISGGWSSSHRPVLPSWTCTKIITSTITLHDRSVRLPPGYWYGSVPSMNPTRISSLKALSGIRPHGRLSGNSRERTLRGRRFLLTRQIGRNLSGVKASSGCLHTPDFCRYRSLKSSTAGLRRQQTASTPT